MSLKGPVQPKSVKNLKCNRLDINNLQSSQIIKYCVQLLGISDASLSVT